MNIYGTNGRDTIRAGNGHDVIFGYAGDDTIYGQGGNDWIHVTFLPGNDYIHGGAGFDTVEISNRYWTQYRNRFEIYNTEFNLHTGRATFDTFTIRTFSIEQVVGTGNPDLQDVISAAGATRSVTINLLNGRIVGAASGLKMVSRFEAATGGLGRDTLIGDHLQNELNGGANADTMNGQGGYDLFWVDNLGDRVVDTASRTIDTVIASVDYTLPIYLENLILLEFFPVTTATGNAHHNFLLGNASATLMSGLAGHDVIWGQDGNDTLLGGLGNDFLSGGAGDDTFVYIASGGHEFILDSQGQDILDMSVFLLADIASWVALDGPDADTWIDQLAVYINTGSTITMAQFFDNSTADINLLSAGTGQVESIRLGDVTLQFTDILPLITADPGLQSTLLALQTNVDWMNQGFNHLGIIPTTFLDQGDNFLIGTPQEDIIDGLAGNDTIRSGVGADTIYGNEGNDVLLGGNHYDQIYGGPGNDTIKGGPGTDLLLGGSGDDTYSIISTTDMVVEDANNGNDTVVSTVSYRLTPNVEALILSQSAGSIHGTGNELHNAIRGNAGANRLYGLGGNDTMWGGGSNDTLYGGTGHDLLNGDSRNDMLFGDDGNDTLWGGTGNDTLTGGQGDDVLYGESDRDVLISDWGNDTLMGGISDDTYRILSATSEQRVIQDTAGLLDVLDLRTIAASGNVTFQAVDGSDADTDLDALRIVFGSGAELRINQYFANAPTLSPGNGLIERIMLADTTFDYNMVVNALI